MDLLEEYLSQKLCVDYHRKSINDKHNDLVPTFKISLPVTKTMMDIYLQLEEMQDSLSYSDNMVFFIQFSYENRCEIISFKTQYAEFLVTVFIKHESGVIHIEADPYIEIIDQLDCDNLDMKNFIQTMNVININIGVLGHVDSGKTSLCKALSTTASTACFDKNPQSKERGITLDLGFSSFQLHSNEIPSDLKNLLQLNENSVLQYTLVDCPGHASLIRTIICGAQIIDLMILVIDVTKGIQTQTAECLVIGEILCDKMVVILNKIDLIPEKDRSNTITKMKKRLSLTLAKTKFANCSIVAIAANPGGISLENDALKSGCMGFDEFVKELLANTENPTEKRFKGSKNPLIFAIDHCFSIRGQGTVLTGTVLSGSVEVGDTLSIPVLELDKKIKSMQIFRKPVNKAIQGDRVGICVTQMDASLLERGLACHSSSNKPLSLVEVLIARVTPINHFKSSIKSKSKFHFAIGQDTVMGSITLFTSPHQSMSSPSDFDWSLDYEYLDGYSLTEPAPGNRDIFVLVRLEKPVICAANSLIISSKLDTDIHSNVCRLAFYGRVAWMSGNNKYAESDLPNLKVYKLKSRIGVLERLNDSRTAIVKNLFKKETNIEVFQRMKVRLEECSSNRAGDNVQHLKTPVSGYIEGNFGQSGKCKIILEDDLPDSLTDIFSGTAKRKKGKPAIEDETNKPVINVVLEFKRFVFDPKKKMIQ